MTYSANEPEFRNIGVRTLRRFMRMPDFRSSLTSSQAQGANKRILTATWQPETRIVYDAIQDGYTSMDSLPVATGLSETQIRAALEELEKKGAITVTEDKAIEEQPAPL